ncbi:type III secretion system outer membrane ring subunit SctC [Achromobacter aloeverae]|nr:type III secretion system outer membrane ring subunit SctC [Achromobacter aloeverae]
MSRFIPGAPQGLVKRHAAAGGCSAAGSPSWRRAAGLGARLILAALLAGVSWQAAAGPRWPQVPYTYFADQQTLQEVLQHFASGFSLSLRLGTGVGGIVSGKFNTNTPTDFLDRLGGVYGFNWFVYAGTLYVSDASEVQTRTINAGPNGIGGMRQALLQLGVLDPRFGWGELPGQDMALVSGPKAYVDLVARTSQSLPTASARQEIEVFRLKYASVSDRTVMYRDQASTTPGVATVLRNLIEGTSDAGTDAALRVIAQPLRPAPTLANDATAGVADEGSGPAAYMGGRPGPGQGAAAGAAPGAPWSGAGARRRPARSIQADPRLNAVIIQDTPERMPIYRALIAQLDVPSTLIEIEAIIVDVNASAVNELGVDWQGKAGRFNYKFDNGTSPGGNTLKGALAGVLKPGALGLGYSSEVLNAQLNVLETNSQADVLARPSVVTTDNTSAVLDLKQTFYIEQTGERVTNVTPVSVGTSLRVVPRFIEAPQGRQVELTIDIEDGNVIEGRVAGKYPTTKANSISTLALVGDGQTLVIGGYNSNQLRDEVSKIPLLGDIPILGALFSNRSKSRSRTERLFMIRPRIVAINGRAVVEDEDLIPRGRALDATWTTGSTLGDALGLILMDRGASTRLRQ